MANEIVVFGTIKRKGDDFWVVYTCPGCGWRSVSLKPNLAYFLSTCQINGQECLVIGLPENDPQNVLPPAQSEQGATREGAPTDRRIPKAHKHD
jgi:hypothetical protein